jgi:hypothetical protein
MNYHGKYEKALKQEAASMDLPEPAWDDFGNIGREADREIAAKDQRIKELEKVLHWFGLYDQRNRFLRDEPVRDADHDSD